MLFNENFYGQWMILIDEAELRKVMLILFYLFSFNNLEVKGAIPMILHGL